MTDNECKEIIKRINLEEKWLFNLYAEHRLSTGDIDIAMGAIRSKVSELKENQE